MIHIQDSNKKQIFNIQWFQCYQEYKSTFLSKCQIIWSTNQQQLFHQIFKAKKILAKLWLTSAAFVCVSVSRISPEHPSTPCAGAAVKDQLHSVPTLSCLSGVGAAVVLVKNHQHHFCYTFSYYFAFRIKTWIRI